MMENMCGQTSSRSNAVQPSWAKPTETDLLLTVTKIRRLDE